MEGSSIRVNLEHVCFLLGMTPCLGEIEDEKQMLVRREKLWLVRSGVTWYTNRGFGFISS